VNINLRSSKNPQLPYTTSTKKIQAFTPIFIHSITVQIVLKLFNEFLFVQHTSGKRLFFDIILLNIFFFIQSFDYCFARYKIAHAAKGYGVKKPLWRPQSSPKQKNQKKITKKKAHNVPHQDE
jgi:hypothetical protein